jgi:DNA-binding NtrC family response regulator
MIARALLISTENGLPDRIREALISVHDCELDVVANLDEARAMLDRRDLAIVLLHLEGNKEHEIRQFTKQTLGKPHPPSVVAISDQYDPGQAVTLLQQGFADYLPRPLDLRRLAMLTDVFTWRARQRPVDEPMENHAENARKLGTTTPLYCGEQLADILDQVRSVAPLSTTILLTGETGTGKTRLARRIHELSPRRDKAFLAVNCGGLALSLVESELFGHVKSAFTGADADRAGKFAAAGDGTLLLDEIDSLPLATQPKLLRAVDERVFEPVGSDQSFPVRARLIVATNRCLQGEIAAGRFRPDLYYRLNVVPLHLPPLRERREIIPALVNQFIAEFAAQHGRRVPTVLPDALRALAAYTWPGNIRELRNVMERAVALDASGFIGVSDLPKSLRTDCDTTNRIAPVGCETVSTLSQFKAEAESTAVLKALASNDNNRSRAARALGISRVTLYKKLHKYGLSS